MIIEMKKRSARSRHNRRTSRSTFKSNKLFPVIAIATLVISAWVLISVNQGKDKLSYSGNTVLGESDSGSGSSGNDSSGSGSSGSDSSGSNDRKSGSSGSDSGSGSGSSGSESSGSGSSGSGSKSNLRLIGPQPTNSFRPSPTPVRIDEEMRDELTGDRTRVQVDKGQTRLEQEIFEGGVRKRVEMRNENGRIFIRVKTKDATGAETDQRLELRPEEGLARLRFVENGVEKDVRVRAANDRFVIEQEGFGVVSPDGTISALTNFPLTVDPETNTISVTTPIGTVNVQQLPVTAIQNILAANVIDKVESTELTEPKNEKDKTDPNKQVVFRIKGIKETRFLGLIKVDVPILAEVSAITGQTTFVQQPWFLNAFGFLFAK